jgi:hypothetical protein
MLRAAGAYARVFDWWVLPIKPGTKEPHPRLVRHGFLDATRDAEQITRWWRAEPTAPVAIACAMSGLVVLDVDPRNGGDETLGRLQRDLGPLPTTPTVLTPGPGMHLYFLDTVGEYIGSAGDGIEIKSAGYVLAPPSLHPNGGRYVWDVAAHPTDTPVAHLPDRWLRHLTVRTSPVASALPSSGSDPAISWLGIAFAHMQWLGAVNANGTRNAQCPWVHEHTDARGHGNDSSTVLFPPADGHTLGGFACLHSHCAGRTWRDVVAVLPARAKWAADEATRAERNRNALTRLDAARALAWTSSDARRAV